MSATWPAVSGGSVIESVDVFDAFDRAAWAANALELLEGNVMVDPTTGAPRFAHMVWPDGSLGSFLATLSSDHTKVNAYTVSHRPFAAPKGRLSWADSGVPISDAAARLLVKRVPEIRPDHAVRNAYVPSDEQLATMRAEALLARAGWTADTINPYIQFVTGRIGLPNPTTDEILQWASYKWGIPTDALRAQAHLETRWEMDFLGDRHTVSPSVYALHPEQARIFETFDVYQSLGMMQVQWTPDGELGPGADPLRYLSTAFNVDYCCAFIRFHLDDPDGNRTAWGDGSYVAHDYDVAQGGWFQPYPWRNSGQLDYVAGIADRLRDRPWVVAEFTKDFDPVRVVRQPTITRSGNGSILTRPPITEEGWAGYNPPGIPTSPTAQPGNGQVTLNWTPPAEGEAPIAHYRFTNVQFGWTLDTDYEAQRPYTLSGLTNGQAVSFTVRAVNVFGQLGAPSVATSLVTPQAPGVPGAPTNVIGTPGNHQVSVDWDAPGSNGGSAITGYRIVPYRNGVAQTAILTGSATPGPYMVTGLDNGVPYTFVVRAINGVGQSSDSSASSPVTPVAPTGFSVPPEAPIISELKAVRASNEDFTAAARAVDTNRRTTWNSVYNPTTGAPQWIAVDLSTVANADKTSVWAVIENITQPRFITAGPLGQQAGSQFFAVMRNYKLQAHAGAGGGAAPADTDGGWVDLVTVTDNRRSQRVHTGLNLSGYNWFKIRVTECNSAPGVDGVNVEFELRDVSDGVGDSILAYGDSISMETWGLQSPGADVWEDGGIGPVIAAASGRVRPIITDYSVGGWTTVDGATNVAAYTDGMPHKVWVIAFGHNDAHNVGVDYADLSPSGINSTPAQAYKTRMQTMIDHAIAQGAARVVIPYITWTDNGTFDEANTVVLNAIIDQLVAENEAVQLGPDLHSFFAANPTLLRDHIHPTYSGSLVNGLTGYGNVHALWAAWLDANLYS